MAARLLDRSAPGARALKRVLEDFRTSLIMIKGSTGSAMSTRAGSLAMRCNAQSCASKFGASYIIHAGKGDGDPYRSGGDLHVTVSYSSRCPGGGSQFEVPRCAMLDEVLDG